MLPPCSSEQRMINWKGDWFNTREQFSPLASNSDFPPGRKQIAEDHHV
jgi:hypothetical protein